MSVQLAVIARGVASLLALALVFDLVTARYPLRGRPRRQLLVGLAVGGLVIGIMAAPLRLQDGLVFDSRSVLLAVSGLFLGPQTTAVAMLAAAAFRIWMGGAGAVMGVSVIVASGLIGIAWRWYRKGELENIGVGNLYLMGLVVHLVMIALMATLPRELVWTTLEAIAMPVLVTYPAATAALGALLASRLRREQVAAQLEESEARYRSIFENNHAVMLLVDPTDDRIVDANPAALRFYGWTRAELCARRISDINTLSAREVRAEVDRARAGEREFFQFQHRLATGEVRDVEVLSGPIQVAGRALLYSIVHDVTAQRRADEALRLRSAALEAATNAIMITDRDGTIIWVNPAFTTLYGYEYAEAVGQNPRELLHSGVHGEEFYGELWRTILAGDVWRGRITNRRKDGTTFEEDLAITPLRNAAGEVAHFIAVKQDLTDLLELERRLALAQTLESVGRLAGGVAHDFNNLLTVVNGTSDLILADLPADHTLRPDLEQIRQAGERGGDLTRQLLAFSRRQVPQKEVLDLGSLVADMLQMLRRLIGEDVRIDAALPPDGAFLCADRSQLEQVIVNLVVNARDAMPQGGTLTIGVEHVVLGYKHHLLLPSMTPGPYVCLTVRDTGTGIDPQIRSRIFDPFFTTKEVGKGTGLGLATVYGIVSQSGGCIDVESAPARGAAFHIYLPRTDARPADATPEVRSGQPRRQATILVVEDEEPIRRLAQRILRRDGYAVLSAASGTEATALLETQGKGITLLFTDVVMPGMSGPELVERACQLQPGLKVLFTSGYSDEILTFHGVNRSGHELLPKPYTAIGLTGAVRAALDS